MTFLRSAGLFLSEVFWYNLGMDTIEHFSDFLRNIGAPNFLAIGIVIIVLWLLISGLIKGLRKWGQNKDPEDNNENHAGE